MTNQSWPAQRVRVVAQRPSCCLPRQLEWGSSIPPKGILQGCFNYRHAEPIVAPTVWRAGKLQRHLSQPGALCGDTGLGHESMLGCERDEILEGEQSLLAHHFEPTVA